MVKNARKIGTGFVSVLAILFMVFASMAVMTVGAANSPPDIMSTPETTAWIGHDYHYKVVAIDFEGDKLNYTLFFSPAGMTINKTTGDIHWTPNRDQTGQQIVGISVSDNNGGKDMQNFTIEVYEPPPPMISMIYPYDGQEVSGVITFQAYIFEGYFDMNNNGTMENVTLKVNMIIYDQNKNVVWSKDTMVESGMKEPFRDANLKVDWDTMTVKDGKYFIMITATDPYALSSTVEVNFVVDNTHAGEIIWFVSPQDGTTVKGYVPFKGATAYTKNITKVQVRIEYADYSYPPNVLMDWTDASGIYNWSFGYNFTAVQDQGSCFVVSARALYYNNDLKDVQITVCTDGVTPPPPPPGDLKVFFLSPADGSTVSGTVIVSFGAYSEKPTSLKASLATTSSSGQQTVLSSFTGQANGKDKYLWNYSMDTTTFADGKVYLTLTVSSDVGQSGSAGLGLIISNAVTPPPPPPTPPPPPPPPANNSLAIYIYYPKDGATVNGVITVAGQTYCFDKIRSLEVLIFVDGQQYTQAFSTGGGWQTFTFELNTKTFKDGNHTISVSMELNGETAKAATKVIVKNGGTPPPPPPPPSVPPPVIPGGDKNQDGSVTVDDKKVTFQAPPVQGMDNSSLTYTWEFGDGTISHDKNPTHTYNTSGDYKVKLTVNDGSTQKASSVDLKVGHPAAYKTSVPGFGASALVLVLIVGCVATFFRRRK
jgi:hypothetical protein